MTQERVIIIGSGPAAHTAAIYTARAQLKPLVFEGFMAGGVAAGGQLTTTTEVENFPGFTHIPGPELMDRMREQSIHCGARIETLTVEQVDLSKRPFRVTADKDYLADALIIATGATAKRLNLPGEDTFWQRGVSACAVCDGALPIFRDQPVAVIGGGDTAMEEATFLTKYASKVFIIHRRKELRASKAMQERAMKHPKIEFLWDTVVESLHGDKKLQSLDLLNRVTDKTSELNVGGLFYAIGHTPNTSFLSGGLELDDTGYIVTAPGRCETSVAGVFAAGDVKDKVYRQAITAAGSGCQAAMDCEKWLEEAGGH